MRELKRIEALTAEGRARGGAILKAKAIVDKYAEKIEADGEKAQPETAPTPTKRKKAVIKQPLCWTNFHTIKDHADRILMYGPAGTGKTSGAVRDAKGKIFHGYTP